MEWCLCTVTDRPSQSADPFLLYLLFFPHNLWTAYETAEWTQYRVELADVPRKARPLKLGNSAFFTSAYLPLHSIALLCLPAPPSHRGIIYSERWWICMSIYSTSSFKSKFIRFTDGTSQTLFVAEFFVFFFSRRKCSVIFSLMLSETWAMKFVLSFRVPIP